MSKNLTSLREGDSATVAGLLTVGGMRRRLLDLGLIEGTQVWCTQKSAHGDLIAYAVRGAVIALRNEDAETVLVH